MILESVGPLEIAYSLHFERFLEPRLAWMSEAGGKVILDHEEIRFRPRSDGF